MSRLIVNSVDIVKPLEHKSLWSRVKDVIAILTGRSQAFHYFEAHTVCIRTGYDLYECSCERCIKLDKRKEKING